MKNLLTRKNRPLGWKDVEDLGVRGRWRWVRVNGREYTLDQHPLPDVAVADPAKRDEIRITERRTRTEDGATFEYPVTLRGLLAPEGAFERVDELGRSRPKATRKGPVNVLSLIPGLSAQPGQGVTLRPTLPTGMLRDVDGNYQLVGNSAAGTIVTADRGAIRTLDEVLAWLADIGAVIRPLPKVGRVYLAEVPVSSRRTADKVARRFERLIYGRLTGSPVRCELEHEGDVPHAIAVLSPDVAACRSHAAGELS